MISLHAAAAAVTRVATGWWRDASHYVDRTLYLPMMYDYEFESYEYNVGIAAMNDEWTSDNEIAFSNLTYAL